MIEVMNLSLKTAHQTLLQDVSLSVAQAEILGLIGASGSGKTSLLRAIAGLNRPSAGEIRLSGRQVSHADQMVQPFDRKVSMVFQSLALWPHMTARKHLEFVVEKSEFADKIKRDEHIESLFNMMHLNGYQNRYPSELSGGEQQRLAIARAMASSPKYLLMDEPFSSLDDVLRTELLDITLSLRRRRQITIIYVTHNIDEAIYLADRISIMSRGRVVHQLENKKEFTREQILHYMRRNHGKS